jgi:hypothetical protein
MTYEYVGTGLCFPIKGREEVGMTITIDFDEFAQAYEKLKKTSPYDKMSLVFMVLPLKPGNVTKEKTHSVKLTDIKEL